MWISPCQAEIKQKAILDIGCSNIPVVNAHLIQSPYPSQERLGSKFCLRHTRLALDQLLDNCSDWIRFSVSSSFPSILRIFEIELLALYKIVESMVMLRRLNEPIALRCDLLARSFGSRLDLLDTAVGPTLRKERVCMPT